VKKIVLAIVLGVLAVGSLTSSIGCNDSKATPSKK
jgi:hypothetical protein